MADFGNPVRIKCLPALAFSIARQRSTNTATKPPGKNWPRGFQKRHPALKSRRVRAMAWERYENNIYDKIIHWFEVIREVLQDPAILPENVYNMDETGVILCMLGSIQVLLSKDDPRDYRGAGVKRTMVTAIECISANGRSLLPMIIWPATTHRSNWTTFPTPGWHYICSESGYTDSKISLEWLKRVFDPQTRGQANQKPRVLICDGFGTHETLEALEFCFENNIILCRLPSHTSHKLQPCDVGVFASLKAAYRDEADRLFRRGANTVGKQHFTSLYSPTREKAFTKRNIMAGWAACGSFPFNPDRVLRVTPKPPTQSTVPRADEIKVGSCHQDEVPQTPITPVSAEGLTSLQNLIKQDVYTLNGTSIQRLERHVQKLANAAQISFAERALLHDQNQILTRMNNEAKVRRSTRSIVLGKAKVMSFEDIEVAHTARAVKEVIKGKGKRGRKRKRAALEADEPETEPEEAEPEVARAAKEAINGRGKRGRKRKSAALEADDPELELELEPKVAQMIDAPVP
jgi:DDE superfamily endonuclease